MPTQVLMPALSPTMEEGTLAKWLVSEGQEIKAGDVIAEIETDKATMEVEAVDEGTVAQILVPEDTEGVAVNTPICILAAEGESVTDAAKAQPAMAAKPSQATVAKADVPNAAPTPRPAKPCSVIGVSMTRFGPNSSSRPWLTL